MVKYILREKLRTHQILREWRKKVGQLDFSIIDHKMVLLTDVDERSYKIHGARLSADAGVRADLEGFFQALWQEGQAVT